jgi:hypothetical protein
MLEPDSVAGNSLSRSPTQNQRHPIIPTRVWRRSVSGANSNSSGKEAKKPQRSDLIAKSTIAARSAAISKSKSPEMCVAFVSVGRSLSIGRRERRLSTSVPERSDPAAYHWPSRQRCAACCEEATTHSLSRNCGIFAVLQRVDAPLELFNFSTWRR